ncbi:MAG: flagellin [Anaerolineae bacterium]|nr:flagellin [Anaerolineae bacterium]
MPNVDLTRIGSNIGAMYSLQSLLDINNKLAATQTRLATGKRINSAADDPAGLTIATKMNARAEGLRVTMDNISDAKNMLSVAESGINKLTDILTKMRSKANQAASDTLGTTERQTIQSQLQAFAAQIDDIINETKWNGVRLLDGSTSKTFQTGVDAGETTVWSLSQKHDAISLRVATKKDAVTLTEDVVDQSFVSGSLAQSTTSSKLSSIKTGAYGLYVVDMASGSAVAADGTTQGTINLTTSNVIGFNSLTSGCVAAAADELASGTYRLDITNVTTSGCVSYNLINTLSGETAASGTNVLASTGSLALSDGSTQVGLTLNIDVGAIQTGAQITFEYIKSGDVKIQMKDSSGLVRQVLSDGNLTTGSAASAMYVASGSAAAQYETGVGVRFGLESWSQLTEGQKMTFEFEEMGQYVVNVSTASKAAEYMSAIDRAMDIVNQSMADLGSLMARMTIKEEAASAARINIESAYNRIMNANMAEEQVNASKYLVLQQTAVAMLAQANQAPQFLLSLFR